MVVNKTDQDPYPYKAYFLVKDNVLKDEKNCGENNVEKDKKV